MHDVTHEAAHSAIFSVVSRQTSMCVHVGEKSAAVFRTNAFRLSQAAHERSGIHLLVRAARAHIDAHTRFESAGPLPQVTTGIRCHS